MSSRGPYRRVTHELRRRGHVVNHKRVARLMKAHNLGIKPRRRFVRATDRCPFARSPGVQVWLATQ